MKLNLEVIIIVALFLINACIGGFFLLTITSLSAPAINSTVEIIDVTKDSIHLDINISIENNNFFSFIADDFLIISMVDNKKIGEIYIDGGTINGDSTNTFGSKAMISLENYNFNPIEIEISGVVGAEFFSLYEKEIPVEMTVIASFDRVIENIDVPNMHISGEISKITDSGIDFSGFISIDNPNRFEMVLENISSNILDDSGASIGNISVLDSYIKANSSTFIELNGKLHYEALNSENIFIEFKANAGVHIAGLNRSIPVSTSATLTVPDINVLLLANETLDFSISAEFKIRLKGIVTTVGFKIYNPSNIPFEANNLHCKIFSMSKNETMLIAEGNMSPCDISTGKEVCIKTELIMPYKSILKSGISTLIPDWFLLRISGDFSIKNTTLSIPISLNGYVDPKLFS